MTEAVGRRERKKEETRRRIFDAALALFRERGFDDTTIDDIAERADVAKGTFFNYFPRKESLIEELADEWIRDAEARAAKSGASALGRLRVLYGEAAGAFQKDPDLSRAVMRSSAQRLCCPGGGGAPWHQFESVVLSVIAEGQQKGEIRADLDVHVMHGALVSCFVGGVMWWLGERGNGHTKRRSMTLREVIAALQGVTMDGMKAKRNGK